MYVEVCECYPFFNYAMVGPGRSYDETECIEVTQEEYEMISNAYKAFWQAHRLIQEKYDDPDLPDSPLI
jgi:hypothetical protein